jgi:type IV secretion system protein VirD4
VNQQPTGRAVPGAPSILQELLRRRKFLVLVALWAVFMVWMVLSAIDGLGVLLGSTNVVRQAPGLALVVLDLWAFAAGLVLALVNANLFRWSNGWRLAIGCMAFAMVLGRLVAGFGLNAPIQFHLIAPSLIFFGTPFLLMASGFAVMVSVALLVGLVFAIFVFFPALMFNTLFKFKKEIAIYNYRASGLAGYVVRLMRWLKNDPEPEDGEDDSQGARFASPREIVALHQPRSPKSMGFGHYGRGGPLMLETEKHVLIMASTRSGKGVNLIVPHLLRYQGSAFVLDPKGENAIATGRCRRHLNQQLHVLDPFDITGLPKSRFNPLARFTPENMEAESKALAAAMFVLTERERGDHFMMAGRQLLASVILFVYASPNVRKKDLPTVRKLLLGSIKETLQAMQLMVDVADGLLHELANSFLATPEKEFGSVVSTAQRQTEILDNPFMVACLSATGDGPEVDFKAWRSGTMTCYLCLSAPKFPTFNRWLRLILTSALDEMTDTLDPPTLPVCFMLDELATLGHLEAVENAVGLAAGYGIQLVTVFQDVAQMRDIYKGRWSSFIGNAGIRAVFNVDDYDTAEYWSKFLGGRLVETRSHQDDIYGYKQGDQVGEAMRPLLSADQLMLEYASGKMLILAQGEHPIPMTRVPYFKDEGLKGLWDDPRARKARPAARRPAEAPRVPPGAGGKPAMNGEAEALLRAKRVATEEALRRAAAVDDPPAPAATPGVMKTSPLSELLPNWLDSLPKGPATPLIQPMPPPPYSGKK